MNTKGSIKYAYLSPRCESLIVESTKPVTLPSDGETDEKKSVVEKKEPRYFWQQSTEDVKIWFGLPGDCVKDDIKVDVTDNALKVSVKDRVFVDGTLFQRLNADLTTWSIIDNRYIA
jgi:hypothetical protein